MGTNEEIVRLVEPELSGGKISRERISTLESSNAKSLIISGLRQDTFEFLVENFGSKFSHIEFWKCPRVEDLSPLETLSDIKEIDWFWNLHSTKLWDMSKNKSLKKLRIGEFQKVKSISALAGAKNLEELRIEKGMWKASKIDSLEHLSNLPNLKLLHFNTQPLDKKVGPLAKLSNLKELAFSPKLFKTDKIAWLKARIGERVESEVLQPYWAMDGFSGPVVLIIGKGKPFLNPETDKEKIAKYVQSFEELVDYYLSNPELKEPA